MDNKNSQEEHLIGYDEYDQSGKGLIKKRKRNQRIGMIMIIAIVVVIIAICLYVFLMTRSKKDGARDDFRRDFNLGMNTMGNVVTASGTTSIGMDVVTSEIDYLENTTLYIEDVYVSSNDEVEVGAKILKLTQESIVAAKKELEDAYKTASLSYNRSLISTEQSKISAKYDYEKIMLEANQAKQVYEDKIASLESDYNATLEKYNKAKEKYEELNSQIMANTLEEYYDIPNLSKEYQDAKELYDYCYEKWEITEEDMNTSMTKQKMPFARDEKSFMIKAIQEIQTLMEDAKQKYDEAQEKYKDALTNGELKLKVLKSDMDTTKLDLDSAQLTLEKDKLSAKTTYETSVAKSKTAKTDYDTNVTSLEESLDKLKDEMDKASKNLEHFNKTVGDGYLYTEEKGTVMMVSARKNATLGGNGMIMAYSVPDKISVSVSVPQDSVAMIEVGENATVMFSEYGNYTGKVASIDPVSSSNSRTSVTYSVIVNLEGDVSALTSNLTATVMFGADATNINTDRNNNDDVKTGKGFDPSNMPEGFDPSNMPKNFGNGSESGRPEGFGNGSGSGRPEGFGNGSKSGRPQGFGSSSENKGGNGGND